MSTQKQKIKLRRVNMNLPFDLVEKVLEYGNSRGLNATNAYIVLLNQALEYDQIMKNLPFFVNAYKTLDKEEDTEEKDK